MTVPRPSTLATFLRTAPSVSNCSTELAGIAPDSFRPSPPPKIAVCPLSASGAVITTGGFAPATASNSALSASSSVLASMIGTSRTITAAPAFESSVIVFA